MDRRQRVRGNCQPDSSVQLLQVVTEEEDADGSPPPELGRKAARELRWLGGNPIVNQGRTREEQKWLDIDSSALFVEEVREWLNP